MSRNIRKIATIVILATSLTFCKKSMIDNDKPKIDIIYTKFDKSDTITSIEKFDTLICNIHPHDTILAPVPFESFNVDSFDINSDNIYDFKVKVSSGDYDYRFCWPHETIWFSGLGDNEFYYDYSESYCPSIELGDAIHDHIDDGKQEYWQTNWVPYDELSFHEHTHFCDGVQYMGFRVKKNNEYYYGWLKTEIGRLTVVLEEVAINSQPNHPIIVGEK